MMEALTAFDAVAIVIVIVSTLMALARGFMRELATLGAFIAAIAAAFFARKFFVAPLTDILPSSAPSWMPDAIIFVVVFLIVYVAVAWFGANLSKSIQGVDGIGLLDRLAGGVFGFARGGVVLVFFVYLLNLAMDKDQIPEFVSQARTYPIINAGADYLKDRAPELAERSSQQPELDVETPDE
ncbi:MAG: CvpA family protein [Henriciella sp.]|jgi:membrane protein required for colicin V production